MSSTYAVRVAYVDDSYWDDGSRWTSQTFKFDKKADAITFAREAVKKGVTLKGQNGDVRTRPNVEDVSVTRTTLSRVEWANE